MDGSDKPEKTLEERVAEVGEDPGDIGIDFRDETDDPMDCGRKSFSKEFWRSIDDLGRAAPFIYFEGDALIVLLDVLSVLPFRA